jgi:outer membrane protein OmpA-like peptidoglycan-associated protein
MKSITITGVSRFSVALLAAFFCVSAVHSQDSNEEKLKELERAMRAPATPEIGTEGKGKRRTRAIVFDSEPQAASTDVVTVTQLAAGPKDCMALPANVQSVSVDFAINFNVGSAIISPTSESTLSQISKVLALNPTSCIIVEGHTDASGNPDKNLALSRERAVSVVNFVSDKSGIERKRLVPVGKGSSDPAKNLDARDPKNRRVVFKVVNG